jgi:hypothetical protein
MEYKDILFSGHSIQRMFERGINPEDVEISIKLGEIIAEYNEDVPFPSRLILNFINGVPLHIVAAHDEENNTIFIITAYIPDSNIWDETFKTRRIK